MIEALPGVPQRSDDCPVRPGSALASPSTGLILSICSVDRIRLVRRADSDLVARAITSHKRVSLPSTVSIHERNHPDVCRADMGSSGGG